MRNIILVMAMLSVSLLARGADFQRIVQDTQKLARTPSEITLVWWIPSEFWDVVMRDNPSVTEAARTQFIKSLDNYLVIVVVDADVGPMGGLSPKDRAAIESNTQLLVDGVAVSPLALDEMSPDALNFVTMMKPVMENALGQLGKGMEFFVYPNPPRGETRISALKPGRFSYTAFGNKFDWRLPVGSLLPNKVDKKTGEVFPGDYMFNPYTGDALSGGSIESGDGADLQTSRH